jgi:magnesium chelatase family protein
MGNGKWFMNTILLQIYKAVVLFEKKISPGFNSGLNGLMNRRPFRAPHHTISDVALVGGGAYPQPGEISLSHNGVLFLDELPEFKRSVLEVMRQPLEDREVTISRARFTVTYPSSFMLVASMNPSPSGYFMDANAPSTSTPYEMQRYMGKLSGPLLDRIDLHIEVQPVPFEKLSEKRTGESSKLIRERVASARSVQTKRYDSRKDIHYNAQMNVKQIREFCVLDEASQQLIKQAMKNLNLSARAYDRILKVARTIADLEAMDSIAPQHIAEAIQYRSLDREGWLG